nr:bifunctional adenosylcobinamide kinase/adenosylcobinamide-phosphate guanylyltransferase [Loigolactobacillus coryniformis]
MRDIYGDVNQYLAQAADQVYFVISGLPQQIK